jgi:GTP:adenosylcobinamide-phosphate guanylyltransferase
MNRASSQVRVVVLAARRAGAAEPLASRFGVSHKCLVPLIDKPLIAHVVAAIRERPEIGSIAISVEPDVFGLVREATDSDAGIPVTFVPAADNIADSVIAAAAGHNGPIIVTTADNVLLDPASIAQMCVAVRRHDVVFALAPREAVLAAHPEGQRRFYRFRNAHYSNCNLYGMSGPKALHAAEIFRGGGQFAKKAGRVVEAFGLVNLILLRLRWLTLAQAARRISRRIGLGVSAVVLSDGTQAIDVDNDRTYAVAAQIMGQWARRVDPAREPLIRSARAAM